MGRANSSTRQCSTTAGYPRPPPPKKKHTPRPTGAWHRIWFNISASIWERSFATGKILNGRTLIWDLAVVGPIQPIKLRIGPNFKITLDRGFHSTKQKVQIVRPGRRKATTSRLPSRKRRSNQPSRKMSLQSSSSSQNMEATGPAEKP